MTKVLFVSALPGLSDDIVCVDNNTAFTVTRLMLLCWQTRPGGRIGINAIIRRNKSEIKRINFPAGPGAKALLIFGLQLTLLLHCTNSALPFLNPICLSALLKGRTVYQLCDSLIAFA